MVGGRYGRVFRDVRRLFDAGTVASLGEAELLERFVARRDEAAFAALLVRHGPMILGVCRRSLHDPRDVEDAFQATVLILIRKAGSIREPHLLGPWLHGVACRVARRARKVAIRRAEREREAPMLEKIEAVARPVEGLDELKGALDQEISRLPDKLRLPVVLCLLEGLTQPEAATRLRTTPDGVRGRLARAREKLKARLTHRGFAIPGGLLILDFAAESASAAVPASLTEASLRLVQVGAVPTASVAILTNGVIRAMTLSKLKTTATALLCLGTVAAATAGYGGQKAGEAAKAVVIPPKVAEKPEKADNETRSILVEARDLVTDEIVPETKLTLVVMQKNKTLPMINGTPGSARFPLPETGEVRYLQAHASREGYVDQYINWFYDSAKSPLPPDHLLFQMEKGTTITGRVVDQSRKPVADATVVLTATKRYPRSEQWVGTNNEFAKTDANGRWSVANVPAQVDSIELAAFHPLYLTDQSSFFQSDFKPLSALRDGTAVLELGPMGTRIDGQVVGIDGRPVADAEIFYGKGRRYGNSIPPFKTDSQGRFALGIKPGTITSLTAQVAGFPPIGQELRVGTESQQVTLTLKKPNVLEGRVVDRAGKPIPGATVTVGWSPTGPASSGRGSEAIAKELTTDAEGRFAWNEAPEGGAIAEAGARGYPGKSHIPLSTGTDNEIVLTAETTVKGSVVDGETGQPVPKFTLTFASVRNPGERLIWQRVSRMDKEAKKSLGSFEYTFGIAAHQFLVRVEGEGYLPEDTELFSPDGTPREFTFRLTKAAPIRGTVANPDGSPAQGSVVYLVPANEQVRLVNGEIARSDRDVTIQAKVAPDGRFSLNPRRDDFVIFALSDAGIALARRDELKGDDSLRLRAWAKVGGSLKIGEPALGIELYQSPDDDASPTSLDEPRFYQQYFAKVDGAGRFEFPKVAPGRHTFGQWIPNAVAGRQTFVAMTSLDARDGQSYDLKIGENGRTISGKLEVPAGVRWMVRRASNKLVGPKGQDLSRGVRVFEDGRFRILDLPPGEYSLQVSLHEPPSGDECGWGRLIARFSRSFTISGEPKDGPLDLGTLKPTEVAGKPLQVGEDAPALTARALDGREFSLTDYRGKFVLLDFWATWCAPCMAEVPNLKAVHEAFGADPRFALVSLSVDEDLAVAKFVVDSEKMSWKQGALEPDSPVVAAYGSTAIPATFLIGPDGKIIARDLRGPRIKEAVERALKP